MAKSYLCAEIFSNHGVSNRSGNQRSSLCMSILQQQAMLMQLTLISNQDELSTCHWKVYGVDSNGSDLGTSGASVNQLFKKIQICALALREAGCLTCPSSDGTGIWVFSLDTEFSRLKSFASNQSEDAEGLIVGQVPIYGTLLLFLYTYVIIQG